jgi:GNAT superfamily N-acetyltransferase
MRHDNRGAPTKFGNIFVRGSTSMADSAERVDAQLVETWLRARSLVRKLPQPVPDHGGLRVETDSTEEIRRYVFAHAVEGLRELAATIKIPRILLKFCGPQDAMRELLPARWQFQPPGYIMVRDHSATIRRALPVEYRLEVTYEENLRFGRILTSDGDVVAFGYAAQYAGVFIYDRIVTNPLHRRRGLATALIGALEAMRTSRAYREILVATQDGRALYTALGWTLYSPYTTAFIPLPA